MPVTNELGAAEDAYRALLDQLDGQDLATLGHVTAHLDSMVRTLGAVAAQVREQVHGNAVAAASARRDRSDQTAELNEAANYLRHLEHLLEAGAVMAATGAQHIAQADQAG